MKLIRTFKVFLLIALFVAGKPAFAATGASSNTNANSMSFGDAALTVLMSTAAGSILGASTLPFYAESSKHTKNIFYGAAFGAVIGVMFSAYAALQDGAYDEDTSWMYKKQEEQLARDWHLSERTSVASLSPALSSAPSSVNKAPNNQLMLWQPLAEFRF